MKISEMTNDQATEAMVRLAGPFAAICDDEKMLGIIDKIDKMGKSGEKVFKAIAKVLPEFVTLALKDHKEDLYEIVGVLLMKPANMVGYMNFKETVNAVKDSYDDILSGFFTQSAVAEKIKETE